MSPDPYVLFLAGLGAVVLLVAWVPLALKRAPLSLAILCVLIGLALFGSGLLAFRPDPRTYDTITERLCELVVIISLMGAGLKLDRPFGWKAWRTTWRLLAIAMPLTIAAVAALGHYGLGFPLAMALLFGAALAPTDPVLASDVQVGPPQSGEEDEVRFGLTSEAGLNDGLAFPFVMLAIVFAQGAQPEAGDLLRWLAVDVAWRIVCGVAVGWLVGRALGWLAFGAPHVKLSHTGDGLVAIGATLLAYAVTEVLHGYGFLAVFIAALALRRREPGHEFHTALHDFAEQIERLLMMLVLVLFGGAIAGGMLAPLTWRDAGVAVLVLLVARPLAGWLSLAGTSVPGRDRGMIAFLGIRGIGSFYYLAYALNHATFGDSARIWAVTGLIVLLSILIHGVTATPLMLWIDAKSRAIGSRQR
ncbi:sodium:proton antiporter [Phenylobacterium sp.]|uniref:cation:proton antiporter n=1 Tax=Phenylobacterium sp. TaxID=1871053 RepID=UPI002732A37E|nr:cation:proton antiporter [Phenylobacterium sp.]MDP3659743.1 cation:proton antiporter [Phenylobacterium sp.]